MFTHRFSRFTNSPSHMLSWFLSAVVSTSGLTHSTKMSDALSCPTYPPSLGFKHTSYCWKLWLAYIQLHFLSGNNAATFMQTKASLPYSNRRVNMGLLPSCLLCSELAPERIFCLHVTCLLPGRLTEVSSYRWYCLISSGSTMTPSSHPCSTCVYFWKVLSHNPLLWM